MSDGHSNRDLTPSERHLVRWMLEHGGPDAQQFLPQLERVRVTPWRCPCGCASINFVIEGKPEPPLGMRPIADYLVRGADDLSGIFVFEQSGALSGLEVYGFAGDAPATLPTPDMLRTFSDANSET